MQLSLEDEKQKIIKQKQKECVHEFSEAPLFDFASDTVYYVNFCNKCGLEIY